MASIADFSGTWRADLAASRLRGPTPTEMVVVIAHAEPELRVEMMITTEAGAAPRILCDARTTGETITNIVLGAEWVSRSRWVGHELLIESDVTQGGRQMHFRDFWSLSDDGQRLTMEHRGDDLEGQITVLERVDGAE